MWRAMIVDDEPVIRFGIKASIDWTQEDIVVTDDCANGAEALRRLEVQPVDILITDIKMPIMDGLTLTRQALALNPAMKVILVSSHNDFEFVREGLKLGVADYILKHTLEPEELLAIIRKCKEQLIHEEQLRSRLLGVSRDELAALRRRYEGELKLYLIHSAESLPDGGYPEWMNGPYAALCVRLNKANAIEEQQGYLYKSVLLDQMTETIYEKEPEAIAVQTAENELLVLQALPSGSGSGRSGQKRETGEPLDELQKRKDHPRAMQTMPELKRLLEKEVGANVTIGCSEGRGTEEIRLAFAGSREAADRSFFEGGGIYVSEPASGLQREGRSLPDMLREEAEATDERLGALLAEWRADWAQGGCPPIRLKEQASRVLSNRFKHAVDPYALVEAFDRLFKTETLGELCDCLLLSFGELRKARLESFDAGAGDHPIDKAMDYINAHYLKTLTLQQVADYVHVSKNYFSILFKKTTGQNFIDYLIMLRIRKAKELLAGTELKVYEVAEQSGFNDVKYFSKLFKKMCGHSPIDYRELLVHQAAPKKEAES